MPPVTSFTGSARIHIGLGTTNLDASIAFYRTLFGVEPDKVRPGYARFAPIDPSVNLSLNHEVAPVASRGVQHYGVQVKDPASVHALAERLAAAGLPLRHQDGVVCCHARQDKVWVEDPDGRRWEIFATTEDVIDPATAATGCGVPAAGAATGCCAPAASTATECCAPATEAGSRSTAPAAASCCPQ